MPRTYDKVVFRNLVQQLLIEAHEHWANGSAINTSKHFKFKGAFKKLEVYVEGHIADLVKELVATKNQLENVREDRDRLIEKLSEVKRLSDRPILKIPFKSVSIGTHIKSRHGHEYIKIDPNVAGFGWANAIRIRDKNDENVNYGKYVSFNDDTLVTLIKSIKDRQRVLYSSLYHDEDVYL